MLKISNPPKDWEQELGALIAIKIAVKETSTNVLLHIETDCKKVVKMLTSQLYKLENQGFLLTQYPNQTRALVAELKNKKQDTSFLYKPLDENNPFGAEIIKMLNEAANLENETRSDFEVNPEIIVSGAKLSKLTQATAYRIIRSLKMKKYLNRR